MTHGVFTLRITFAGLCLFVREGDTRVHVLLINHGHGSDDEHHARLVYDRAFATPGATKLERFLCCDPLSGCTLKLEGYQDDPFVPLTAPRMADLQRIAGVKKLARKWIEPNPGHQVAARITIGSGKCSHQLLGPDWTCDLVSWQLPFCVLHRATGVWPDKISHRTEWTIDNVPVDDPKNGTWILQFLNLRKDDERAHPLKLHAIDHVIDLHVYNTVERDLPPAEMPSPEDEPKKGDKALHFDAYYCVTSGGRRMIPKLAVRPPRPTDPLPFESECTDRKPDREYRSGHSSTCVSAFIDAV
jgi:hypothetical protein